MKKIMILGIVLLFATLVVASNYIYKVEDRVTGKNLELVEFEDDIGLIDNLVSQDLIKNSRNDFKGDFGLGITENNQWELNADAKFNGIIQFDDNSKVKYEVTDFEITDANIDEDTTEAFGKGTLVYEATIKIRREIPVDVAYSFYQDSEDKNNFMQRIFIDGENTHLYFEDDGKQRFNHNKKCYVGC